MLSAVVALIGILVGGSVLGLLATAIVKIIKSRQLKQLTIVPEKTIYSADITTWRMPALDQLKPMNLTIDTLCGWASFAAT